MHHTVQDNVRFFFFVAGYPICLTYLHTCISLKIKSYENVKIIKDCLANKVYNYSPNVDTENTYIVLAYVKNI